MSIVLFSDSKVNQLRMFWNRIKAKPDKSGGESGN